ncbi:hypothetical protein EVAR_15757_1 [Eumeta japonica]|uniref:Uncharacterized protein n=1 Tax=Eumeta variegata TaxID=151549 RepID=A0A4C1TZD5_EUMVA|nr:hypothetical protein EVAR_15757_1 [Eumeta japonica]
MSCVLKGESSVTEGPGSVRLRILVLSLRPRHFCPRILRLPLHSPRWPCMQLNTYTYARGIILVICRDAKRGAFVISRCDPRPPAQPAVTLRRISAVRFLAKPYNKFSHKCEADKPFKGIHNAGSAPEPADAPCDPKLLLQVMKLYKAQHTTLLTTIEAGCGWSRILASELALEVLP